MHRVLLLFLMLISAPSMGQNLGIHGSLWEIKEEDAVDFIKRRVKDYIDDGTVEKMQKEGAEKIKNAILNPKPVPGIKTAAMSRTRYFDPTVSLERDMVDASGRVIFRAGTKINPLLYGGLSKRLIFIDARDKDQVDFAVEQVKMNPNDSIILVGGDWVAVSKLINKQAYFDQAGEMTRRFTINQVPTILSQDGLKLKLEEVGLKRVDK